MDRLKTLVYTRLPGVTLAFIVATLGAVLFVAVDAPLPIFLGSLTACMIASIVGLPLKRPRSLTIPTRMVLGVAIGSSFTPALLDRAGELAISLLLIAPYTAFVTALGYLFYRRIAGFDPATSFFVSVPGGLTEMVFMSKEAGANERMVTLMQSVRLVLIVFAVPVVLSWTSDLPVRGAVLDTIHIWEVTAVDAAVMLAIAVIGWQIAAYFGILGASIVGPMIISGTVHAMGLTASQVPSELLIVTQVTLGILLGAQFRGLTLAEFTRWVSWALGYSVIIIAFGLVVAAGIARLTGADFTSVALAYAPGGQSELSLLAIVLSLDVPFIALHHLLRVAVSILGAQLVFSAQRVNWQTAATPGASPSDKTPS
ncbi:MAG: AbrB family transcriptional regulator [Pseudomonadota bacterium]